VIQKLMEKDPARRYRTALEAAAALRPFAERQPIQFDFRELITLRAKLAKARAASAPRKAASPRSSITHSNDWLRSESSLPEGSESFAMEDSREIRAGSALGTTSGQIPSGRPAAGQVPEKSPGDTSRPRSSRTRAERRVTQGASDAVADRPVDQATQRRHLPWKFLVAICGILLVAALWYAFGSR
jgi:hypothetical protein